MAPKDKDPARRKSKFGCRTCKIRKVKCDEARPACHRCVSTGRACDGYGIWGGGVNAYGNRSTAVAAAADGTSYKSLPPDRTILGLLGLIITPEEQVSCDWFMVRTSKKLPGPFVPAFWDTLIFQAISGERAILHAILALSSIHRRAALDGNAFLLDEHERFTLQQYTKSVNHLQPYFSAKDEKTSVRVLLVACIVFISIEALRGCYSRVFVHLCSGLRLLRQHLAGPTGGKHGRSESRRARDSADDWIIEAFNRNYLQAKLLSQNFPDLQPIPGPPELERIPRQFSSFHEARLHLDHILTSTISLTEACQTKTIAAVHASDRLVEEHRRLKFRFAAWSATFEASKASLQSNMSFLDAWANRLLALYLTMTQIMSEVCLGSSCESSYDAHTDLFMTLLKSSVVVWKSFTLGSAEAILGYDDEASKCNLDVCWIPPLYFIAIKCRIHWVRIHAIRLLESIPHQGGLLNSRLCVAIARKVVELEEGDFYAKDRLVDDFPLGSTPKERDLKLPTVPESRRVRVAQVVLPDDPAGVLVMACVRKRQDNTPEVIVKEYSLVSQRWRDWPVEYGTPTYRFTSPPSMHGNERSPSSSSDC